MLTKATHRVWMALLGLNPQEHKQGHYRDVTGTGAQEADRGMEALGHLPEQTLWPKVTFIQSRCGFS